MCGIIGYVGPRPCQEILVSGLEKLEYRGYDSAGLAMITGDSIEKVRATGNLSMLRRALDEVDRLDGEPVGVPADRKAYLVGRMRDEIDRSRDVLPAAALAEYREALAFYERLPERDDAADVARSARPLGRGADRAGLDAPAGGLDRDRRSRRHGLAYPSGSDHRPVITEFTRAQPPR